MTDKGASSSISVPNLIIYSEPKCATHPSHANLFAVSDIYRAVSHFCAYAHETPCACHPLHS
jgi:hypothetical protein